MTDRTARTVPAPPPPRAARRHPDWAVVDAHPGEWVRTTLHVGNHTPARRRGYDVAVRAGVLYLRRPASAA
jgi:hypothetical protein